MGSAFKIKKNHNKYPMLHFIEFKLQNFMFCNTAGPSSDTFLLPVANHKNLSDIGVMRHPPFNTDLNFL